MDDSWACFAAYVYALHLTPSARAWEYLRRNPHYQRDWAHHRRSTSKRIAARWGLATLVDPRFDARQVVPAWTIDAPWPVTLVRDEMTRAEPALDGIGCFSLWGLRGRKSMVGEERGIRLVVDSPALAAQVRLGSGLCDGDQFAYQVPAAANDRAAWAMLTEFRALSAASRVGNAPPPERPGIGDLSHARALQVLDGLAAGASHRTLAQGIFGTVAVTRGWQPDGALRAQIRYLVRKSRALMEGEYRSLASALGRPSIAFERTSMVACRQRRHRSSSHTR